MGKGKRPAKASTSIQNHISRASDALEKGLQVLDRAKLPANQKPFQLLHVVNQQGFKVMGPEMPFDLAQSLATKLGIEKDRLTAIYTQIHKGY